MKVKDLPPATNMGGVKVRTPEGKEGWWKSQWERGVWLTPAPPGSPDRQQIIPQFVKSLRECLEWEVVETESTPSSLPDGEVKEATL